MKVVVFDLGFPTAEAMTDDTLWACLYKAKASSVKTSLTYFCGHEHLRLN